MLETVPRLQGIGFSSVRRRLTVGWMAVVMAIGSFTAAAQEGTSSGTATPFKMAVSGQAASELRITVPRLASGQRLVFSSLRSTAKLRKIELIDPNGGIGWSGSDSEILLVGREETKDRDRGDVYLVGEAEQSGAGVWVLRIQTGGQEKGVVTGAYSIRPRVELLIPQARFGQSDGIAGEPVLVMVMPTDRGKAIGGLSELYVRLVGSDGKAVEAKATGSIKTVLGVEVALPSGQYIAKFDGLQAGKYRATGRTVVNGEELLGGRDFVVTGK